MLAACSAGLIELEPNEAGGACGAPLCGACVKPDPCALKLACGAAGVLHCGAAIGGFCPGTGSRNEGTDGSLAVAAGSADCTGAACCSAWGALGAGGGAIADLALVKFGLDCALLLD